MARPIYQNSQARTYSTKRALGHDVTVIGRLHGTIVGPTGRSNQSDEAFTRSDRRTDWSARPRLRSTGRSDQSDRSVGQTVGEPHTSVNQINVAC